MTRRIPHRITAALAVGALGLSALAVAGCGSGTSTSTNSSMPGMDMGGSTATTMHTTGAGHGGSSMSMENVGTVSGLSASADGYRMVATRTTLPAGRPTRFSFRIVDAKGMPVTKFGLDQTKRMHLIVASHDLSQYQHVHPVMASDGTWSIPLTLPIAGTYRAFGDFNAAGKRHVLGITLKRPGTVTARPLPEESSTTTTGDGYTVTKQSSALAPGKTSMVRFTVTKDGKPVTDLQHYLGALGHLVVLHESDLEYLHVHPTSITGSGPTIAFEVDLKTAGSYRAFLQFQTGGTVRTAAFTLRTV